MRPFLLFTALFALCFLILPGTQLAAQEDNNDEEWLDPDSFFEEDDPEETAVELDPGTGSLDDLFSDPSRGIIEDDADAEVVDLDAVTSDPIPRVSGRVRSRGGLNLGLRDWDDWKDGTDDPRAVIGVGGLFDMDAVVRLDYRPTSYQRLFASVKTEMDHNTLDFSRPEIGELFVDYTYRQNYFFRAGKQGLTWGQARLLDNKANFVSNLSNGIGLRANAPIASGLTGVLYTTSDYRDDAGGGSGWRTFGYAGLFESSLGRSNSVGFSSHYRYTQPLRTAAYFRSSLGSVDIAAEGVTAWDVEEAYRSGEPKETDPVFSGLVNAFWESSRAPRVRLIGEYQFDGAVADYQGHRVGLGARLSQLSWTRWNLNLRWRHSFFSNAGDALVGLSGTVAPGITAAVGVPVFYSGPDFLGDAEDENIPNDYVVSALITLSMTISF